MAVNRDRITEIVKQWTKYHNGGLESACDSLGNILSTLPEFQTPEWVRCSERMPELNDSVWVHTLCCETHRKFFVIAASYCARGFLRIGKDDPSPISHATHWMPRHVPAPPVEEESDTVKDLRTVFADDSREWEMDRGGLTIKHAREVAILIVKRHEQKAKAGK